VPADSYRPVFFQSFEGDPIAFRVDICAAAGRRRNFLADALQDGRESAFVAIGRQSESSSEMRR